MSAEFREKLRSIQFSTKGFVTRDRRNYYDAESIEKTFGHDAKDRMMDKTQGLGGGEVIDGEHYHYEHGERVRTTSKQMNDIYLNAKSEDWEN
jgi:hypothetical protein